MLKTQAGMSAQNFGLFAHLEYSTTSVVRNKQATEGKHVQN